MPQKTTAARLNTKRGRFEVMVDERAALDFKNKRMSWRNEIVSIDQVYKDHKKGLKAPTSDLKEVFGTTDPYQIGKRIVEEGELLLSLETTKRLIEEKRRQIANLISKIAVDPGSNLPIPPLRVQQAMAQSSVSVDPTRDPEDQVNSMLSAISAVLPLKVKEALLDVRFSARVAQAGLRAVEGLGEVRKRMDDKGGEVILSLAVPEALRSNVAEKLSRKFGENVSVTFK